MKNWLRWCGIVLAVAMIAVPGWAAGVCGPMDVVFVIDTTGSMGGSIEGVKSGLTDILAQISTQSGGDFRVGLVEFGLQVTVDADLGTETVDAFTAKINALGAAGGGNEPEASDEALNTVINHLKAAGREADPACGGACQVGDFNGTFRTGAAKIIVFATDARPGGFDDTYTPGVDDVFAHKIAVDAKNAGIRINSILPLTPDNSLNPTLQTVMKDYAITSGGSYTEVNPDGSGTAGAIDSIIKECGGATPSGSVFLTVTPDSSFLSTGEAADFTVDTATTSPFNQDLILSVVNPPDGSTVSFDPILMPAPGTGESILHFDAGTTLPGTYFLDVDATSADGLTIVATTVTINIDCRPPFLFGTPDVQPASQTVTPGTSGVLTVLPGGSGPFTYQWYIGPSGSIYFPVDNGNAATLTTPPINSSTDFWVRVTNPCGSYDSFSATVSPGSVPANTSGRVHSTTRRHP